MWHRSQRSVCNDNMGYGDVKKALADLAWTNEVGPAGNFGFSFDPQILGGAANPNMTGELDPNIHSQLAGERAAKGGEPGREGIRNRSVDHEKRTVHAGVYDVPSTPGRRA